MARNEDVEVYGVPQVFHNRYYHPYTCRRKTTGNLGDIIPIYNNILVQPGDTISMSLRSFFKMTTSLFPSMDVIYADIFAFAQDWQNDWIHTKEFWGEDEATPFDVLPEYTVPKFVIEPEDAIEHDDILHHLAVPQMEAGKGVIPTETRINDIEVERLSYNTYIDIYNRYFRDQNYITKLAFSTGDEDVNYSDLTQVKLLKAARLHDYFSGTPDAQKGEPEFIPIGTQAPVIDSGSTNADDLAGLKLRKLDGTIDDVTSMLGKQSGSFGSYNTQGGFLNANDVSLIADLTNVVGATLNALRLRAAEQQIKEELMWYGSRFEEIIYSQWGVQVNAASMRIPEYLGGKRITLNMDTVLQTSETSATSPLGDSAGYSVTLDEQFLFTKSFTTWQNIMVLVVLRQDHSYAQGIANQHLKSRKFDFYWDKFAGIGAQPRKKMEICVNGTDDDNDTWNFAPAWREYTSEVDRATGLMQPGVANTLANYTYTDEYTSIPNSGQSWIDETPDYVDRTLVVDSDTTDQFRMDFVFDIKKTSIIPNFKLPGLDKL